MNTIRRIGGVLVAGALAVPTWAGSPARAASGPMTLGKGFAPSVVLDRHGTATVVWAAGGWPGRILASTRPGGGAWSDPVTIGHGTDPTAVVDAEGDVTVVYSTNVRNRTTGMAAVRRPVGGAWRSPVRLTHNRPARHYGPGSPEGVYGAHRPDVAVDPRGDVVVVWQWGSYDREVPFRIQAAWRPAAGHWRSPQRVTPAAWWDDPHVAMDPHGHVTAVFERGDVVSSRRARVGHGWGPRTRVTPPRGSRTLGADLVMDRRGVATFTYDRWTAGRNEVHAMRRGLDRVAWGPDVRVSPRGAYVFDEDWSQTVGPTGRVTVLLCRRGGRVDVVHHPPRGRWSPPRRLGSHPTSELPVVTTDRRGDLVAVWAISDNDVYRLVSRIRPLGGTWTQLTALDTAGTYVESVGAALRPDLSAVLAWSGSGQVYTADLAPQAGG